MKIQIFNRLIRHGESFRAPRSVQESIPVRKIYRDGVWLCGGRYSKMWRFQDVNYAVASEADQSEILMRYCSVINAWPDDAYVQVLTNNRRIDPVEFENTMLMHLRGDDMDRLREEYNQIVRERTEWSNNIFREKYIVLSVQRRSIEEARSFFACAGTELASGFGRLSSQLTELSSHDRIRILHDFFRSGEEQYFNFDLSQAMARGQDFRDYIAPDSLQFRTDHFIMGKKFGRVLFLKDYPNFLKDETIARLCEFPQNLMLSIQIVPVPMEEAVADMQKRVLAVETDITRWQQKQNANHNFSAEPPYEMQQMRQEMKALLDDLTSRDQRMVLVLVTLVHLADSYVQLNSDTEAITATARGDLCRFNTLHFQQEEGLNTALPYGLREIEAMRTMNTESAAALTPFSVQDVMDRGGIYYGRNAISRNSIICNRKLLLNGNGFYLGVPGSGKSMAAKWELMNVMGIFAWPLPQSFTITSQFGYRTDPFTGEISYHSGTDIAAPYGTPVLAAAGGTVTVANATDPWGGSYGYYVKIQHDGTFDTLYAHCSSICVTPGQQVRQGEVIGYVGSTGNSTGNHLHFEVWENGQRMDAMDLFTEDGDGNEAVEMKEIEETTLTVYLHHTTPEQMAAAYGFTEQQNEHLVLLWHEEYSVMWASLLGGFTHSGGVIGSDADWVGANIFT